MSSPIALIFGVGKNVGANVAKSLAANGYKVAIASRSSNHGVTGSEYLHTPCDLADPSSVEKVFDDVRAKLGHPSVVVYNAAAHIPGPDKEVALSLPLSDLQKTLDINFMSTYVAAREAVSSFEKASPTHSKVFIYTGNRTNVAPVLPLLSLGIGKSATANLIYYLSSFYRDKGYRFYYADERNADGSPAFMEIDGPAHGEFYLQLAKGDDQSVPWMATFVKGQGYKDFGEILKS